MAEMKDLKIGVGFDEQSQTLLQGIMSDITCGYCGWRGRMPDAEALERMYDSHTCDVAVKISSTKTVPWHESVFGSLQVIVLVLSILAGAVVFAAFGNGWEPWK